MGDILFDWSITKSANQGKWFATRNGENIAADSFDELREKVRDHITRDDPHEHILALLETIVTYMRHTSHNPLDDEDQDACDRAEERARAYLKRESERLG